MSPRGGANHGVNPFVKPDPSTAPNVINAAHAPANTRHAVCEEGEGQNWKGMSPEGDRRTKVGFEGTEEIRSDADRRSARR